MQFWFYYSINSSQFGKHVTIYYTKDSMAMSIPSMPSFFYGRYYLKLCDIISPSNLITSLVLAEKIYFSLLKLILSNPIAWFQGHNSLYGPRAKWHPIWPYEEIKIFWAISPCNHVIICKYYCQVYNEPRIGGTVYTLGLGGEGFKSLLHLKFSNEITTKMQS